MPIDIQIDYDSGVPVYRQICDQVRAAITNKRLALGEQLPTIHRLASTLSINPNTVARAFRDLENEGVLMAVRGKGTFPASVAPASMQKAKQDKEQILEKLLERTMAEGARLGLTEEEILIHLGRRKS